MAAELIVAPEAGQDVAEAHAWYESQRTGLGEEFLNCVDACIEAICRTPYIYMPRSSRTIVVGWCDAFRMRSFMSVSKTE